MISPGFILRTGNNPANRAVYPHRPTEIELLALIPSQTGKAAEAHRPPYIDRRRNSLAAQPLENRLQPLHTRPTFIQRPEPFRKRLKMRHQEHRFVYRASIENLKQRLFFGCAVRRSERDS